MVVLIRWLLVGPHQERLLSTVYFLHALDQGPIDLTKPNRLEKEIIIYDLFLLDPTF